MAIFNSYVSSPEGSESMLEAGLETYLDRLRRRGQWNSHENMAKHVEWAHLEAS